MKRIIFAMALLCAYLSAHAQHSVQVTDGAGRIGILAANPLMPMGITYFAFPSSGGTLITTGSLSGTAWMLTGNASTTAGTDYVGTSDNVALHLYTNAGATNSFILNTNGSIQRLGGNARGTSAVDNQLTRTVATQVASGLYSTIGGGRNNTASGFVATVGGGYVNTASGDISTVGGGGTNTANGFAATVGGGYVNTASAEYATGGGGGNNTASGGFATVGGGGNNTASGFAATVGGGSTNTASNNYATVGGGENNTASGLRATVGGGISNTASADNSTVGGGSGNDANANNSTIAGGIDNLIDAAALRAFIGGGSDNTANGQFNVIGGGYGNTTLGNRSAILGGGSNTTNGDYSAVIGGRGMQLDGDRSVGFNANDIVLTRDMSITASDVVVFANADLWLANNRNQASELRFYEAESGTGAFPSGTKYVALKSPATLTATQTYELPLDYPSSNGQVLSSTTGGAMSWSLVSLTSQVTGILPAANGGTGVNGAAAANGTLLIGNGTGYTLATPTAGSGITITPGAGSITIATAINTNGGSIMGGTTGGNSNGARFASPFGTNENATESDVQIVCPRTGVMMNLFGVLSAAPGAGTSKTITVRINGVNSLLAVTIANAATTGSNVVNTVNVSAGDLISVAVTHTGGPSNSKVNWGFEVR